MIAYVIVGVFNIYLAQMLVGLSYNGNIYFYDRSINGDINAIIDKHGTVIVKYKYGDFGELLDANVADTDEARLIYELNPFIYKGYFYDKETKFYYLKTRYYDPELGRFISADSEVGSIGNTMGMNLYAYCKCNPIKKTFIKTYDDLKSLLKKYTNIGIKIQKALNL